MVKFVFAVLVLLIATPLAAADPTELAMESMETEVARAEARGEWGVAMAFWAADGAEAGREPTCSGC